MAMTNRFAFLPVIDLQKIHQKKAKITILILADIDVFISQAPLKLVSNMEHLTFFSGPRW